MTDEADPAGPAPPHLLDTIRTAIATGDKLRLRYTDGLDETTDRVIWPIDIIPTPAHALIAAWCELRGAFRSFRPDRIVTAALVGTPHGRPLAELRAAYDAPRAPVRSIPAASPIHRPQRPLSEPVPLPPTPDQARLAARLLQVAANLSAGRRETPQRLIPLARHAAREDRSRPLLSFLLHDAMREAEADPACASSTRALLVETACRIANDGPNWHHYFQMILGPAIEAAAPCTRRRRHIHCHGWITSDRRLLLLRAVLEAGARPNAYHLYLAAAYTMVDYDRDHFEMIGEPTASRIRRLATWLHSHQTPSAP